MDAHSAFALVDFMSHISRECFISVCILPLDEQFVVVVAPFVVVVAPFVVVVAPFVPVVAQLVVPFAVPVVAAAEPSRSVAAQA